jgi:hypothetical protein
VCQLTTTSKYLYHNSAAAAAATSNLDVCCNIEYNNHANNNNNNNNNNNSYLSPIDSHNIYNDDNRCHQCNSAINAQYSGNTYHERSRA